MKSLISKSLKKNGYLLIIAVFLYALSFLFNGYKSYLYSPEKVVKQLNDSIISGENKIYKAIQDSVSIAKLAESKTFDQGKLLDKYTDVGLFIYLMDSSGNPGLVYWNNSKMLPEDKDLKIPDGNYPTVHVNGYFEIVKRTFILHDRTVVVCGMVPVYWNYGIKSKYLNPKFPIDGLSEKYSISKFSKKPFLSNGEGKPLFSLYEKTGIPENDLTTFSLRILAIIFFLVYINLLALLIMQSKGWPTAFTFLFIFLLLLRFISYLNPFQFRYITFPLFDSTMYGSNFLHPTLGDLLINVLLVYWLINFVKSSVMKSLEKTTAIKGLKGGFYSILLGGLLVSLVFVCSNLIQSLIKDSQISFDVTDFFSLNLYSFLSFIILCFIILSFFQLSHILLLCFDKVMNVSHFTKYVIVAVISLACFIIVDQNALTPVNELILLWLLIYVVIMHFRKKDMYIPILQSSFFILWIIFFSLSISALIIYQNSKQNDQKRIRAVEKLATEPDKNAQNIFITSIADIDSSFLTSNVLNLKNPLSNKALKDSLSNRYLSVNSDAYETHIYTYDENKKSLFNEDSLPITELQNLIITGNETGSPDLYYYEKELNIFSFIYQKEIRDTSGEFKGYFFMVADPKKYKSQTVYPELFLPGNPGEAERNITYAIYNNGKLVQSSGDNNFPSFVPTEQYPKGQGQTQTIYSDGRAEYWYNAGKGKLVIAIYLQPVFLEFITLFAYLFIAFLLIILFFQISRLLVIFQFNFQRIRRGVVFKIKNQIQAAIVFISVFSFLVIGFSTITFYISRFTQTSKERLIKSMKILSKEVEETINQNNLFTKEAHIFGSDDNRILQKTVKDITELHSLDANFYDLKGNLLATTQPEIYKKQVLNQMMNPDAFHALSNQKEIQFIQEESVSTFSFQSIYETVYNPQGQPLAFLNIPYLDTQKELNQEISNFLVTLINLNAFIFLMAGAISVLLTNRITRSFSLIANKMKKVNLGSTNEKIIWKSNDEIGALVNEFNKMVKKLEDSAQALAKSEREGAWREMARQVAHEIKNPLTPMKLSIQYLQKAIQDKNPNTEELSKKVSATLVEQIDQLAKIASDFSQFANITKIKNETFDLTDLLKSLVDLYCSNEKVKIKYNYPSKSSIIKADRSQMNRLFTNLFQNAIEASSQLEVVSIIINQEIKDHRLFIHFEDQGSGIPEGQQDKIFTPNFTTKTSGTGLGLAISKGIVENANGKIWFDTEDGKGTTFHIELPMVRKNFKI